MQLLQCLSGKEIFDFLQKNKETIAEENRKLLLALNGIWSLAMLIAFLMRADPMCVEEMQVVYLLSIAGSVITLLVTAFVLPKHPRLIELVIIDYQIFCFTYTIFAGVIFFTAYNAVSFHIFLLLMPILFLLSPRKTFVIQLTSTILFCMFSAAYKPPALASSDMYNALIFCFLSLVLSRISALFRIRAWKMLEQQREMRHRLDNIINNVSGGILIMDRTHFGAYHISLCSDGLCRMTGLTHAYVLQHFEHDFFAIVHPSDRAQVQAAFEQAAADKQPFELRHRIAKLKKKAFWVNANVTLSTHEDGTLTYYVNYMDLTVQMQFQKKLQHIYDMLQESILKCRCDENWTVVDCNRHFYEQIGCTQETFAAQHHNSLLALIHPDHQDAFLAAVLQHAAPQLHVSTQSYLVRGDGTLLCVWIMGQQLIENDEAYFYCSLSDITEQKAQEHALLLSKQSMAAAITHANLQYWEYDIETARLFHMKDAIFTQESGDSTESSPASIIETGCIHPEDVDAFRQLHQQLHHGEKHASCIIRLHANGKNMLWRWYRLDYTTVFSRENQPIKAFGSGTDITDEIYAKQQYEELVALQQITAQDSLISSVLNLTRDHVEHASSKVQNMWHLYIDSVDEELRVSTSKVVGEKNRIAHGKLYNRAYLLERFAVGETEFHITVQQELNPGNVTWLNKTIKTMKNPITGDIMAFTYALDVSENVVAEKLIEGIVAKEFDFAGLIYAKTGRYSLFSYPAGGDTILPLSGENFDADNTARAPLFCPPEELEAYCAQTAISHILKQLHAHAEFSFLYRALQNDRIRNKKLHMFFDDAETEIICIVCTDVTDIYQAEMKKNELLRHALTIAQQSNDAKSAFLSAMSHDIRTPLNAILGMTRIAKEDKNNREQLEESCRIIEASGQQLLSLINDILDMSKIESGKMAFVQEKFALSKEMVHIKEIFKPIVQKKSQQFVLQLQDLQHDICIGDLLRLQRVLSNLLSNASKFTQDGGTITLRLTEMPSGKETMGYYRFEVIDTGIGMAENQLQNIFEPFYRIDGTKPNAVEGTGLGLSIAKRIVEAQGGTLHVHSVLGQGTTFVVQLPLRLPDALAPSATPAPPEAASAAIDFTGLHFLLVEDHPVNILVAKKMLESRGAAVDVAENGQLGYDAFVSHQEIPYDAVFMDLQMPMMNGYEATSAIRESKHPQATTVPVIAMTANAFSDDIKRCLDVGMSGHIAKPISLESIAGALTGAGLSVTHDTDAV